MYLVHATCKKRITIIFRKLPPKFTMSMQFSTGGKIVSPINIREREKRHHFKQLPDVVLE